MDKGWLDRRTVIKGVLAVSGLIALPLQSGPGTDFDIALVALREKAHNLLHDRAMPEMACSVAGACRLLASAELESDMQVVTLHSYDELGRTYGELESAGIRTEVMRTALLQVTRELDHMA